MLLEGVDNRDLAAHHSRAFFPIKSERPGENHAFQKDQDHVYERRDDRVQDHSAEHTTGAISDDRPIAIKAQGNYVYLEDGRKILDACGGAAVACIGHGVEEVIDAMVEQASSISYVPWGFFENRPKQRLSKWLSLSSQGHFRKMWVTCSGSEATEGSIKLAREYFVWKGQPQRINYIARRESYHGITLGSLSLGGHLARREPFEDILLPNVRHVSACNPYRQRLLDETDDAFVARKAAELDEAFISIGSDTVVAFIAEPVVGAASGCIPAVPGYFKAMKAICEKYGALLILDEVMCGMGRTGTIHAWEQEGIVPDIQAIGKALGGGYQPVSAILAGQKVCQEMAARNTTFTHGHTYQDHPVACSVALRVQQVIERDGLLANVRVQGQYLEKLLRARLRSHPNVGDIRGRGLFWGIEFVRDRSTREPFNPALRIAYRVHAAALAAPLNMTLYHGQGCAGDKRGDHIMIMPAYNVDRGTIELIVERTVTAIQQVFAGLT
ncbi:aminotransferase, class III [Xylariales sp. PMI_506]|nr:aminotransferase, class III [Xylariales sp. PMI_506]